MTDCNKCGVELTDDNWYPSSKRNWVNTCKKCICAKTAAWDPARPKVYRER